MQKVGVAERSKAPDSREILPEHSGPLLWAWVRIPPPTKTFNTICEYMLEITVIWHIFLHEAFSLGNQIHQNHYSSCLTQQIDQKLQRGHRRVKYIYRKIDK